LDLPIVETNPRQGGERRKILVISSKFPNRIHFQQGLFVYQLVRELSRENEFMVVCPISKTPSISLLKRAFKRPSVLRQYYRQMQQIPQSDIYHGLPVVYPRLWYLPKKLAHFSDGIFLLARLLPVILKIRTKFRFDIIHAQFAFPEGFAATMLGKLFGAPSVIHCQGSDINVDLGKNFILTRFVTYTLNRARFIFAASREIQQKITSYARPEGSMKLVPNGVNLRLFFPCDKIKARAMLNLPLGKRLILYVGSLYWGKGVNYLIDAMEIIAMQHQDVSLYILGDGDLGEALARKVVNLKLEDRIFFLGNKPQTKVPRWMNAVDLLVLPSVSEGWPPVIAESLACGTPIVASRVGGIPEVLDSPQIGLLSNPRDAFDLANSIVQGLQKTWNEHLLVSKAMQYSWRNIATEVNAVYFLLAKK
jgi:glycosyltransferase involved in cell wall biosynthesis